MAALSPPPVTEGDLLAYVDRQIDGRRLAEIEAHLAACPDDAARVEADLAVMGMLRLLYAPIPHRVGPHRIGLRRRSSWPARLASLLSGAGGR